MSGYFERLIRQSGLQVRDLPRTPAMTAPNLPAFQTTRTLEQEVERKAPADSAEPVSAAATEPARPEVPEERETGREAAGRARPAAAPSQTESSVPGPDIRWQQADHGPEPAAAVPAKPGSESLPDLPADLRPREIEIIEFRASDARRTHTALAQASSPETRFERKPEPIPAPESPAGFRSPQPEPKPVPQARTGQQPASPPLQAEMARQAYLAKVFAWVNAEPETEPGPEAARESPSAPESGESGRQWPDSRENNILVPAEDRKPQAAPEWTVSIGTVNVTVEEPARPAQPATPAGHPQPSGGQGSSFLRWQRHYLRL